MTNNTLDLFREVLDSYIDDVPTVEEYTLLLEIRDAFEYAIVDNVEELKNYLK